MMRDNQRKLGLIICLFLGILFLFGCLGDNRGQLPVRSFTITIDPSQREELFSQFQKFAAKHDFEYMTSDLGTGGKNFIIEMLGDHIKILAYDTPKAPTLIAIRFYDQTLTNPVSKKTLETIDDLASDLKTYINEISNALITEQRKSLTITIDESQREEFLAQIRRLADEHALEFTLSFSSDKTVFHAEIAGEGFHITSHPVTGSPREILTTFFIDYYKVPIPTSLKTVDELFAELKSRLGEIPNVIITEEAN